MHSVFQDLYKNVATKEILFFFALQKNQVQSWSHEVMPYKANKKTGLD